MSPQAIQCISRSGAALLCAAVAVIALFAPAGAHAAGSGAITGAVTAPGGAPIDEVWACAYLAQSEEFEENCDFTGSDGLYSVSGLEAGDYIVEFWPESTAPSYVGEFYDDRSFWEEADEVEVEEGVATTGIDAELAEAATIEGEVRAASLSGPVEDALICARLPTGVPEGCAFTRPDGSYTLTGLPADEYKIEFLPEAFTYNLLPQLYDHEDRWADADLLAVSAGETKTGIDADLEAGAEIHGTVYSAVTGAPVSGAMVCAVFAEGGWPRMCIPTSGTGSYELFALPSDSYKVAFSAELKDFFGEEIFPGEEDDGYLTQYFNDKPTWAAADLLTLAAPQVRTGIDGHLQPTRTVGLPPAPVSPPAIAKPAPRRKAAVRCRPGFRKKKVMGKKRCVKVKKHKHKRRRQGRA